MRPCILLVVAISLLYLSLPTDASEARGFTDTSNGYCEGDYGKIKVGETGYDDKRCLRILCSQGTYTMQGCGLVSFNGPDNCKLVAHEGHYPNCCKQFIQCDGDSDSK
ncbi:hypothetical protein AVEN_267295-1 [Araneus ventricosus]|uniref:Single domain-containing protein n=1 Tax=Araneus ventricosus TaxID=182803 RepID=A0A4Y2DL17_ARAVE|nr:hypothetical protein AVEN_267295-1 [Araneus ventricosus]